MSERRPKATDEQPPDAEGKRDYWWRGEISAHYGSAEALHQMGSVAAPFLAGFALAVSVQTLSLQSSAVRYRELAELLFLLAAIFLILAVQAMFWARRQLVTPRDLMEWFPDWAHPYRREGLLKDLRESNRSFRKWALVSAAGYDLGLLCLLAGLAVLAVPPEDSPLRWAAVAVGSVAVLCEVGWMVRGLGSSIGQIRSDRRERREEAGGVKCAGP
ncbi:hypothetical protein AB5J52_00080 [Streptomyces sp. R39]|uniref:DUF4328 domain-containing protein n=1 Tax=Streptomyces sp. R39 TaxID=3238631 RepID=A0AB39QDE6_9ACTN